MNKAHLHDHASHERWLVSYADFITLLFAFFVVMFASSQVNKKKVAHIAAAFESYIKDGRVREEGIQAGAGPRDGSQSNGAAPEPSPEDISRRELDPVKSRLEQQLKTEIGEGKLSISLEPRGLVLSLRESALFPPGSDQFSAEAVPFLTKIAKSLQALPGRPIRLEGHTDNIPIHTSQFPSNWELSAARATAVLELLTRKLEIKPERFAVTGYADYHPLADNETAEGRARNRRVDIVILSRLAARMEPRPKPVDSQKPRDKPEE